MHDWRDILYALAVEVRRICLVLILVVALVLAAFFGSRAAFAHSFYPWECCSSTDCWMTGTRDDGQAMVEPDPQPTRDGWLLYDGTLIPFANARPSPDGRFHVCRQGGAASGAVIRPSGTAPCLWVPQGAS
jgi:hypothetical protein